MIKKEKYHLRIKFGKHVLTIISFYVFLSKQFNLLYIYLYIINIFKYLFILSENKESYLYYYIKAVRFSLDPRLILRAYLYVVK